MAACSDSARAFGIALAVSFVAAGLAGCGGLFPSPPAWAFDYQCNPARLESEHVCYFEEGRTNTHGATPIGVNRSVAPFGSRTVVDRLDAELRLSTFPWKQGDKLAAAGSTTTGDRLTYTCAYEMIAPLRNAVMYTPDTLISDPTQWASLTKVLKDCGIKANDEERTIGGNTLPYYGVDTMYEVLKDARRWPSYPERNQQPISAFLDESQLELLCMSTSIQSTHCPTPREPEISECWKPAYQAMYGQDPGSDSQFVV